MHNPESSLWWRDSNKTASGKTGAVQALRGSGPGESEETLLNCALETPKCVVREILLITRSGANHGVITHPLYSAVSVFDGCPDGLEGILTCQPGCIDDGAHCSVGLRGPH